MADKRMLRHTKCSTRVNDIVRSAIKAAASHKMATNSYLVNSSKAGRRAALMEVPSPHTENTRHSAGMEDSK